MANSMELSEKIHALRAETGLNRKVEEWEAGRRKPPEYIPRLKKYQIMYEQQFGKQNKKEHDDTI